MASIYDVDQQKLIEALAVELEKLPEITAPEWSQFVKTGNHKERPPEQKNWWYIRVASVLKQVYKKGPVGVSKMRTRFGGSKNRGVKPHRMTKASGNILRKCLQQLEAAGLVKTVKDDVKKGRIITAGGQALLDKTAVKLKGNGKHKKLGKEEAPDKGKKAN